MNGSCHGPESWGVSWFTAMFTHGSWDHILGNMLFLAIFGKNVEDSLGHLRYLALYVVGGFVAELTQSLITLIGGSAAVAAVPMLGASGAIAAVLGAYFVLYPNSRILTLVFVFPGRIYAWVFLGLWFLYQLIEANFGFFARARQRRRHRILRPRRRVRVRLHRCSRAGQLGHASGRAWRAGGGGRRIMSALTLCPADLPSPTSCSQSLS